MFIKINFITGILFLVITLSFGQVNDTIKIDELVVKGFENDNVINEISASVSVITPEILASTDKTSIVRSVNTTPGIRMEQRSPGSYRINVRGSSLRSPFDVRNVKVYWNEVPFTYPNGTTPLNWLDANQVGQLEIIRGPAANVFGAGNGGVIHIRSKQPKLNTQQVETELLTGSYGLRRYAMTYLNGGYSSNTNLNISHHKSDGYREHTEFKRTTAQWFNTFYLKNNQKFSSNLFVSDLFYEVPGGLNYEQFNENPRKARLPTNWFPGSVEQKTSLSYKAVLGSLTYAAEPIKNMETKISVYSSHSFFEMPFITDFERETRQDAGGRFLVNYRKNNIRISAGSEYQYQLLIGRNFDNDKGLPTTLNFDDEVRSQQYLFFGKTEIMLPYQFLVDAGVSINNMEYDIYRLQDAQLDTSYRLKKTFESVIMPRIGITKLFENNFSVFAQVSKGFSPPSVSEVRTGDGDLNINLQPEEGINLEAGIHLELPNKLTLNVTAFNFSLDQTIVSYTDSLKNTVRFRNTGSTSQKGIETDIKWNLISNGNLLINNLMIYTSNTFNDFSFNNYINNDEDFSGNELTGVPKFYNNSGLFLNTSLGVYINLNYNYTSKMPLNDSNTAYSFKHHLIDSKIGIKENVKNLNFNLSFGVNNLLNKIYSLGYDLNAYGQRYFQTAPGRNFYLGLNVTYLFKKNV